MPREISQREYDRQERDVERLGRAVAEYQRDMKALALLLAKYPDQARKMLRK